MKDGKDEIRLERITKEKAQELKQKEREMKAKQIEKNKIVRGRAKLSEEDRKKVTILNVVQVAILLIAILVEVLSIYDIVPQGFSIISLVVLTTSCVLILRKINKIMQ